jgi:beta-galactosidase
VKLTVTGSLPEASATMNMTYTVFGSGDVIVDGSYTPGTKKMAMMPRFGTELVVASGLEMMQWYGRGPVETYVDRSFERIGEFKSTVTEEWVDYSQPQENGNKTDVRWAALTDGKGTGLMVIGAEPLSVSARHYTTEDIDRAGYTWHMSKRNETYLQVDAKQMGTGGIDSWSLNAYPVQQYRVEPDRPMSIKYRLTPLEGDPGAKARERF